MPKFLTPYIETGPLDQIDFRKNREERTNLTTGGEIFYRKFWATLKLTIKGTNTAADEVKSFIGIMAVIKKLEIALNNAQPLFTTTGMHLFTRHWRLFGSQIRGTLTPATAVGEQTLTVTFPWVFTAEDLAGVQDAFGLDLRDDVNQRLINSARIVVNWGSVDDIFNDPGDLEITSGSISFDKEEHVSLPSVPGQPLIRASEVILREESGNYTGDGTAKFELTRIPHSQILGLTIVQTRDGRAVPFNDETARVRLDHRDQIIKNTAVSALRSESYALRQATHPDNMLFMPLTERFNINSAKADAELVDDLVLYVPVNVDDAAPNAVNTLTVFVEYARLSKVD